MRADDKSGAPSKQRVWLDETVSRRGERRASFCCRRCSVGHLGIKKKRSICKEKCARGKELFCERSNNFCLSCSLSGGVRRNTSVRAFSRCLIILNPRFSAIEHWFDSKLTSSDLLFKIPDNFVAICCLETQKAVREVFADIVPCESI